MLKSLRQAFTIPEVNRCPDGHFRRTIYGAGPYIGDYPEQCMLSCIVQGWCPKFVGHFSFYYLKTNYIPAQMYGSKQRSRTRRDKSHPETC